MTDNNEQPPMCPLCSLWEDVYLLTSGARQAAYVVLGACEAMRGAAHCNDLDDLREQARVIIDIAETLDDVGVGVLATIQRAKANEESATKSERYLSVVTANGEETPP